MTTEKTGGPAFPNPPGYQGMTLRDYFAAKAMQCWFPVWERDNGQFDLTNRAYKLADAMLKEREK